MQEYKGISRDKYPNWNGWGYIALFSPLCRDGNIKEFFDKDEPLQRLVKLHYLKLSTYKIIFNLSFYIIPLSIYLLNNSTK